MTDAPATRSALQQEATERYRQDPYPLVIHEINNPDRMATIARLAGMQPPDVRTARMLEIGGATGLNVLALAQAYPDAHFTAFDIEAESIAVGNALRREAGIENARLEVLDLLDFEGRIDGTYDYIVAHGVFAWVPPPVAEALLALIGKHLSPQGVAMVSFNALPGSYLRQGLRDAMQRATVGATTSEERLARAEAMLDRLLEPRENQTLQERVYVEIAKMVRGHQARVLLHDELGVDWHPRHLADVLAQAKPHGLAFLGDLSIGRLREAFVGPDEQHADTQAAVAERACFDDEVQLCLFRRVLLIRAEAEPSRVPTAAAIESLFVASAATEPEPGKFTNRGNLLAIEDEPIAEVVRRLMAIYPKRVRVADLGLDATFLAALVRLFELNIVNLHTVDTPFATQPGANPRTSGLARALIARGETKIPTLAHRALALQPSVAQAMLALDGSGDLSRFDAVIADAGVARDAALANVASAAMLMRD